MINIRDILLGVTFLFVNKAVGLVLLILIGLYLLGRGIKSFIFAVNVIKRASPAAICLGLKQAGHSHYQIKQEMAAGLAPYIPALKRKPISAGLFWGVFVCSLLGRISSGNHILKFNKLKIV